MTMVVVTTTMGFAREVADQLVFCGRRGHRRAGCRARFWSNQHERTKAFLVEGDVAAPGR